jgi:hypothetical protein
MYTSNKRINKAAIAILTLVLLLSPGVLLAQDESCQGQDPTGTSTTCPLDTWVWVLVIAAAIFGAIKLSANKKQQDQYI